MCSSSDYQRCQTALSREGADDSVLLWGALTRKEVLARTHVGEMILRVCNKEGVSLFDHRFIRELKLDQKDRPILATKARTRFTAKTKLDALNGLNEKLKQKGVTGPVQPFLIQTATGGKKDKFKGSLFTAFQHWQDALHYMADLQTEGGVAFENSFYKTVTIYEHQAELAFLIIDWEILQSAYNDADGVPRRTLEQIKAIANAFPLFIYTRMVQLHMVDSDEPVTILVKNKSRLVPGQEGMPQDTKVSYHFIVEIVGGPKTHHKEACGQLFAPYKSDLTAFRATRKVPAVADDKLDSPIWGVDMGVWHGSQPFSTLTSQKDEADPLPVIEQRIAFRGGGQVNYKKFDPLPPDADRQTVLHYLRQSSYTVPKGYIANYSSAFDRVCRAKHEQQGRSNDNSTNASESRTLTKGHPAAFRGGAKATPPFDGKMSAVVLPSWLHASAQGASVNSTMPCLAQYAQTIQRALATADNTVRVIRVENIFCPYNLCAQDPVCHVHRNNGVFVALLLQDPSTVYSKCCHCKLPSNLSPGVRVLLGSWVEFNQEAVRRLIKAAQKRVGHKGGAEVSGA